MIVNPIVYAEVSVGYDRIEDLDDALPPDIFRRDPLPYVAAFLAGKAYRAYRRRGGARSSPLPDFFIGAHAAVGEFALLTRDVRRVPDVLPEGAPWSPRRADPGAVASLRP